MRKRKSKSNELAQVDLQSGNQKKKNKKTIKKESQTHSLLFELSMPATLLFKDLSKRNKLSYVS
jgi:hypothetical protein